MRYMITQVTLQDNSPFHKVSFITENKGYRIRGDLLFDELPSWIGVGMEVDIQMSPAHGA